MAATRVPEWLGGPSESKDEANLRRLREFRRKLADLHTESGGIDHLLKALGDHSSAIDAYLYCAGYGVDRGIATIERIIASPSCQIDADALAAVAC